MGTVVFILFLIVLNLIGIKESASFNAVMCVVDIFSEIVVIGFGVLHIRVVLHPIARLPTCRSLGLACASWSSFGSAVTVAMASHIGLESLSQAAEETKNPGKTIPSTKRFPLTIARNRCRIDYSLIIRSG